MRRSVVFFLAVSCAMFGFGVSLKCFSCPGGSSNSCEVEQECSPSEDSCLKLTSGEKTFTECLRYADCDFRTLASRYPLSDINFECCPSNLCNSQKKSFLQRVKEFLGVES